MLTLGELEEGELFEWTKHPGYYYYRGKNDGSCTCEVHYIGSDPTVTTVIRTYPNRSFDFQVNRV